jgi:FkbM family methyltransferase
MTTDKQNKQHHDNAVRLPSGLFARPGTYDENIIKEVQGYRPMFSGTDKDDNPTILDIGGQAGYFACMVADMFPLAEVYTFEPEPQNVQMIRKNLFSKGHLPRVNIIEGAISDKRGKQKFYVNQGKPNSPCINTGLHTLRPTRGRPFIEVETFSFRPILLHIRPHFIKCDIEGGEYYLDWEDIPQCVQSISIEMHLTGKTDGNDNRVLGCELWDLLVRQFPRVIKGPTCLDPESKNWTATLIAKRG